MPAQARVLDPLSRRPSPGAGDGKRRPLVVSERQGRWRTAPRPRRWRVRAQPSVNDRCGQSMNVIRGDRPVADALTCCEGGGSWPYV